MTKVFVQRNEDSHTNEDEDDISSIGVSRNSPVLLNSSTKSKKGDETLSRSSSDFSASAALMSSHSTKIGFYNINLGTKNGQRIHALHMLILPLIPVFILLGQNASNYASYSQSSYEVINVETQVGKALELSSLVQRLQEERAAVALDIFIEKQLKLDNFQALKNYTSVNISEFNLISTYNNTDTVLQGVKNWPKIKWVNFFDTKLKFQIQHSIFRTKIREGGANIFEVIDWYNKITSFILDYISYSIHDSDVSDFYRYIISFKNLLRSIEYSSKSGIYGLRYVTKGKLERKQYQTYVRYEILKTEYLSQTFNFMPELRKSYKETVKNDYLEKFTTKFLTKNITTVQNLSIIVEYFSQQVKYDRSSRLIVDRLADIIRKFVLIEFEKYSGQKTLPLCLIIFLALFVPLVAYITLQAATSMFRYSTIYEEKVMIFKQEKRRNEKLLTDLLPLEIIKEMKKGRTPKPVSFNCVSVFLCDIVGFTHLASESTAHQIVEFLNSLYNLFDDRLENYDVYKVETIGDAYMVASGVPSENDNHATEIAKMSLDILAKVVTFETQHKPGYRLKVRIGIHSGSCVGGVVGSKIPRYSIFGPTVDIAGIMESMGKPMKIQISDVTKSLLDKDGSFTCQPRGTPLQLKGTGHMTTYWLIGRRGNGEDECVDNNIYNEAKITISQN